jgi:hypothetical protein
MVNVGDGTMLLLYFHHSLLRSTAFIHRLFDFRVLFSLPIIPSLLNVLLFLSYIVSIFFFASASLCNQDWIHCMIRWTM